MKIANCISLPFPFYQSSLINRDPFISRPQKIWCLTGIFGFQGVSSLPLFPRAFVHGFDIHWPWHHTFAVSLVEPLCLLLDIMILQDRQATTFWSANHNSSFLTLETDVYSFTLTNIRKNTTQRTLLWFLMYPAGFLPESGQFPSGYPSSPVFRSPNLIASSVVWTAKE